MSRKSHDLQMVKIAVVQRLQGFRNHQGRTQEDVVHEADVHPSYITKLESDRSNWTIESLDNILNALDVSTVNCSIILMNPSRELIIPC